MAFKFNPFTGTLDEVSTSGGGSTSPGGSTTQVQFNDGGAFAGDADLTWNKTTNVLGITGDVNLSDGGTYTTTLQTITPTAARTISFPDATGTVALVGGSSGQLLWNNAGAVAGASTLTYDGSILTTSGRFINSYNATALSPAKAFTGTWFTGGTATTTKPQVLIEPTGTTSTAWSTSGTGLGVNASSGFAGNLLDLQVNGTSQFYIASNGNILTTGSLLANTINPTSGGFFLSGNNVRVTNLGYFGFSSTSAAFSTADVTLYRDAANTLAQRNGTAAQTFRVYNTYTDSSNYERHTNSWSGNVLNIANEAAGTGTLRSIAFSANAAASTPPVTFTGTWFTGGTATTTKPQVLIEPTGATSTAWSTSGTGLGVNASSGFAGNLLDLQVNGSNVFSVLNSNPKQITFGGAQFVSRNANSFGINFFNTLAAGDRLEIGVGNTGSSGTVGTPTFYKDTNHLLGLRGTGGEEKAPLSLAIYNTYTSLTNFERGYARWRGGTCYGTISGTTLTLTGAPAAGIFATGQRIVGSGITAGTTIVSLNSGTLGAIGSTYTVSISQTVASQVSINTYNDVFEIGAEKGSDGGTARTVEVHTDSIARLALDTTGSVRVVTGLTVATLPSSPTVGMIARVTNALAPAMGTTVAGGGAAAALVWYNGANWSVIGV